MPPVRCSATILQRLPSGFQRTPAWISTEPTASTRTWNCRQPPERRQQDILPAGLHRALCSVGPGATGPVDSERAFLTTMREADHKSLELVRAAAECGVREAEVIYGQMLLDGNLVERNPTFALHWFERAALAGDVMAINMVGRCLDQGWGVAASPHLAAPWFRKAAECGLDWGMYNLATLLTLGSGVPEDKLEALYWLRKASDLGHAKSINLLGGFHEDGWIVQRDMVAARECYRKAAIGGDFRGQFNYARLLIKDGEIDEAIFWLQKVPQTATPAFMKKMKRFLEAMSVPAIRTFAANLSVEQPLISTLTGF